MDFITKIKQFFQVTLWQETAEQSGALLRIALNSLRVGHIVIRELAKGELNLRAMSLVFTTLLSLVPLIAVAFSVLKAFGVHNQIEPFLLGVLEPLGAQGPEIAANIIGFVQNVKVGVLGSLGVAMLFYTIISLIQKIEYAFNFVWRVKRGRTLARRFTDYLSVVMIGPILVVAAMGIAATVLNNNVVLALQAMEPFGTLILAVTKLLPYLMIITVFTFLYKFIPNTNVRFTPALIGATVAGVLWVAVGTVFASFVASSSNYTAIYSSFAILFFFMIWLYLAWFILLTGSQVAFYLQNPDLISYGEDEREELSPRLREKVGVSLMMRIALQFYQQKQALTITELEIETALSNSILQDLLNTLEQGGLLAELQGDELRYQPAQDIANISVSSVLTCLRTTQKSQEMAVTVASDANRLLDELEKLQQSTLQDVSLRQLVSGIDKT
ncbi:MAG: YihY/virulence factor BrkB family protein [Piscirickettsiaceae bacterium]|jgi:membrane protein|nr:YihY/virulence factor BrkB family protein [Piscirickettsiaceae bacterium]